MKYYAALSTKWAVNFTVAIVLTVLQCCPMTRWIYVSASLRLQVLREKIRNALEIELIGLAGKRVRLSRILEIFDLLPGSLESIEHVTRPFVWHGLVGSA